MSSTFVDECLNPTGRIVLLVLTATVSRGQDLTDTEIVFDLSCLCRTLRALSQRFQNGYVLDTAQLHTLRHSLQPVRDVLERHTKADDEHFLDAVARVCTAVNRVMAETRYILALPRSFIIYPGDRIVQRDSSPDRYDMQKGCILESETQLNKRTSKEAASWGSLARSKKAVYEHVGRLDGGEHMYDPTFVSRCPNAAAEFFTPGRVFAMLWEPQRDFQIDIGVAHYDWGVELARLAMTEGFYTGPYRGPFTARWFIVVQGADSSCFCLSIVTLPTHPEGTSSRRYISIACTGSNHPQAALQVQSLPVRFNVMQNKLQQLEVPPPCSFPTTSLPRACSEEEAADVLAEINRQRPTFSKPIPAEECQRIKHLQDRKYYVDVKRLVEVEYSVKVRNVGVVQESEVLSHLISTAGNT